MGGIAIVVTLDAGQAAISWTRVTRLDLHDELDAGVAVAHFRFDIPEPDFGPVLQSVREQFAAPITLRCYDADRATAHLADHAGVLRRIGEVGGAVGWLERLASAHSIREATVRFTDEGLPPVTAPAAVDSWVAPDGGGA